MKIHLSRALCATLLVFALGACAVFESRPMASAPSSDGSIAPSGSAEGSISARH
jgi:hypothetical protein